MLLQSTARWGGRATNSQSTTTISLSHHQYLLLLFSLLLPPRILARGNYNTNNRSPTFLRDPSPNPNSNMTSSNSLESLWTNTTDQPIFPNFNSTQTFDQFDNSTSQDNLFYVTPGLVVLLSFLYGSISVITVIGNALVILVIAKNKSMHTVTNFYIANLAVADVMIGIFSIPFQFQAALLQRWDLPPIMCPVAPFVKEITVNVSIVTLTVISLDRYIAVIYPLKPRCSCKVAKIVMSIVWLFALGSGVPAAVVFRVESMEDLSDPKGYKLFCKPGFPVVNGVDLGKFYKLYTVVVQYFFPLFIICFAYFRIMHRIWGNKAPGSAVDTRDQMLNKNKRKVIKMLLIVVALFAFCWLPLQTYNLLSETYPDINEYRYINIIWFCSNWLAMSNSCYNPFIYGLLNEKFKHAFRKLFRTCPCRCMRRDTTKEPFTEHSIGGSVRKTSYVIHDDTRIHVNGGKLKKYMRVSKNDTSCTTEQSYL